MMRLASRPELRRDGTTVEALTARAIVAQLFHRAGVRCFTAAFDVQGDERFDDFTSVAIFDGLEWCAIAEKKDLLFGDSISSRPASPDTLAPRLFSRLRVNQPVPD